MTPTDRRRGGTDVSTSEIKELPEANADCSTRETSVTSGQHEYGRAVDRERSAAGPHSSQRACPECDGSVRTYGIERRCEDCGLIISTDAIDRGPGWRSADEEPGERPTAAPVRRARHDRGLSSEIGYGPGSDASGPRQQQFVRMRRQHNRARLSTKRDRNRLYAFTEIRRLVSAMSLGASAKERACALFESAQSADLLSGRSLEGFAAATVYAVCRMRSIARTIDEIVEKARADEDELTVAYDALNRELGLPVAPVDPSEYLPRYAAQLDVGVDVQKRAREYIAVLRESGAICGKNPSGVAAACLYRAARDLEAGITQTEAAALGGVSQVTICSTAKALENGPEIDD